MTTSTTSTSLVRIALFSLATLALIPRFSHAEGDNGELAPILDTVEVTVPSQAERSKSTTFITKHQMDGQHFQNMNDVLFSMNPGVSVARRSNLGFMGPNSGFRIRGLNRERVAVFVDGIPQQVNNHFHPLVDSYTPDLIDRIEITRGTSGVLHGASAAGGVIDIFTPIPKNGFGGYALGSYGMFETVEEQAQASYGGDKGYVWAGNTYRETEGHRPNSRFHANTFNAKGVWKINSEWEAGFRYGQTRADIENPGTAAAPSRAESTQDPTNAALTIDHRTANSSSLVALYWNTNKVESLRNRMGMPTGFVRFEEDEYGLRSKHTRALGTGNTTTIGFDAVWYDDERTNGRGTAPRVKNTEEFYSPYLAFTQSLGNFLVDGGLRGTASPTYGSDIAPEVGVVYKVDDTLAVRGRWGEGYRVPRVNDISAPFGVPNPDAEPEEFWQVELGVNKRFGSRAVLDVAAWHMQGDNLLVIERTGPLMGALVNTGDFEHWGVESSLDVRVCDDLTAFFGFTAMDIGKIVQVPNMTFDFGLDFNKGPFRATLTSRYAVDAIDMVGGTTVDLPDYLVADLHLGYQLSKYVEVFVDVDNFTDRNYQTIAGFQQVPIAVFGGIKVEYNR